MKPTQAHRRRCWTGGAALAALAALSQAEDAPGGSAPISLDALKAFGGTSRPAAGDEPVVTPITHPPPATVRSERPPEIALPAGRQIAGPSTDYGGFDDIRLAGMGGPTWYQLDAGGNRLINARHATPSQGASIAWVGSPGLAATGGLLLGVAAAGAWMASDAAPAPLRLRTISLDLDAGYGLPVGRNIQCEAIPFLGGTQASGRISGTSGISGYGIEWGMRIDAVYTCDDGLQGGIIMGYLSSATGLSSSAGASYRMRTQELQLGGFIGLRF